MTVATTSSEVFSPRTFSSSFITLAGLKKCMPTTSSGRLVKEAMRFTSRVEVLVARMAPGLQTRSSSVNTAFLTSMFSNTASITRSTSLRSS